MLTSASGSGVVDMGRDALQNKVRPDAESMAGSSRWSLVLVELPCGAKPLSSDLVATILD